MCNRVRSRHCGRLGHRAAGAGAGEDTMVAPRTAVMVVLMRRVLQQLRWKALGADFERQRLPVCRHESRRNERACRERCQHQAGGQNA